MTNPRLPWERPLITDAQLAALTIEFGGVLHATDRDFARFPGLRWTNPLA
jgi:predicted nucleic acid-binding protein